MRRFQASTTEDVNSFIAHYWDDLVVDGGVYYQDLGDKVIIEYYQVRTIGGSSTSTWQVILFATGNILMQYLDQSASDGSSATIGIQKDPWSGLQYSHDEAVLSNGLAICFAYPGNNPSCAVVDIPWLAEEPIEGNLMAGGMSQVTVTFDAAFVDQPGAHRAMIRVRTEDPVNPVINVPVTMNVVPRVTMVASLELSRAWATAMRHQRRSPLLTSPSNRPQATSTRRRPMPPATTCIGWSQAKGRSR